MKRTIYKVKQWIAAKQLDRSLKKDLDEKLEALTNPMLFVRATKENIKHLAGEK